MPNTLASQLLANHYLNEHGCWLTDYSRIPGLRVLASTTSGRSGTGKYRGRKVYWWLDEARHVFVVE